MIDSRSDPEAVIAEANRRAARCAKGLPLNLTPAELELREVEADARLKR